MSFFSFFLHAEDPEAKFKVDAVNSLVLDGEPADPLRKLYPGFDAPGRTDGGDSAPRSQVLVRRVLRDEKVQKFSVGGAIPAKSLQGAFSSASSGDFDLLERVLRGRNSRFPKQISIPIKMADMTVVHGPDDEKVASWTLPKEELVLHRIVDRLPRDERRKDIPENLALVVETVNDFLGS